MTAYGASPTRRRRRTKAEMSELRDALRHIALVNAPATVRQVFYRAVSAGMIEKSEAEYKNTVCRLLTQMRLDGELPFWAIADNTRWMRKPNTWDSVEGALSETASVYRRSLWSRQPVYVEVWLEKEALAGVVDEVTERWDVPLMVTRGYPSLSFLHTAAEDIAEEDRPVVLFYLGDHDPSGADISRNVEERIREFAPRADLTFDRLAVTPDQIEEYGLATRPTKRSDSRSKNFEGESVEVDAIEPAELRRLVDDAIEYEVDPHELAVIKAAEEDERKWFTKLVNREIA